MSYRGTSIRNRGFVDNFSKPSEPTAHYSINEFEGESNSFEGRESSSVPFGGQGSRQMNRGNTSGGAQASSTPAFGRGASTSSFGNNRGASTGGPSSFGRGASTSSFGNRISTEGAQASSTPAFGRGASISSFGNNRGASTGGNTVPIGQGSNSFGNRPGFNNNDGQGQSSSSFGNRGYVNERGAGNFTQSLPANGEDRKVSERTPTKSFIPKSRDVNAIFKDDEDRANIAADLYEQDGEIVIEGGPENLVVIEDWKDCGLSPKILENVIRSKYIKPRNFQKHAIPLILEGFDIKGHAETGNGKSAAFLLPIIHMLAKSFEEPGEGNSRQMKVSALIIEPTRELAKQLYEQALKFAHGTGVTVNFAYGAYSLGVNKRSLWANGCDILVGTPGRLKQFLKEGVISAELLQFLVLDEADCLLDYSFMKEMEEITATKDFPSVEVRQTLFFSATFGENTRKLADELCNKKSVLIKNKGSDVNSRIKQEIINVPFNDRKEFLLRMLKSEIKEKGDLPKKLIFVETKRDADYIATMLSDEGIKAQTVNGDRPQELREAAANGFRSGEFKALVVTNVFARGMDFTDLGHVINLHLPTDRETYIHRIGRTGRLNTGVATSFFDPDHPSDRDIAEIIIKELEDAGQEVPDFLLKAKDPFASYTKAEQPKKDEAKKDGANDGFDF